MPLVEHANGVDSLRDFRISNNTEVRQAFVEDLMRVRPYYLLGNLTNTKNLNSTKTSKKTGRRNGGDVATPSVGLLAGILAGLGVMAGL